MAEPVWVAPLAVSCWLDFGPICFFSVRSAFHCVCALLAFSSVFPAFAPRPICFMCVSGFFYPCLSGFCAFHVCFLVLCRLCIYSLRFGTWVCWEWARNLVLDWNESDLDDETRFWLWLGSGFRVRQTVFLDQDHFLDFYQIKKKNNKRKEYTDLTIWTYLKRKMK